MSLAMLGTARGVSCRGTSVLSETEKNWPEPPEAIPGGSGGLVKSGPVFTLSKCCMFTTVKKPTHSHRRCLEHCFFLCLLHNCGRLRHLLVGHQLK